MVPFYKPDGCHGVQRLISRFWEALIPLSHCTKISPKLQLLSGHAEDNLAIYRDLPLTDDLPAFWLVRFATQATYFFVYTKSFTVLNQIRFWQKQALDERWKREAASKSTGLLTRLPRRTLT